MIELIKYDKESDFDEYVVDDLIYSYFYYESFYDWYDLKKSVYRYYFYSYMPKVWKDIQRYKLSRLYLINTNYWYVSRRGILLNLKKSTNTLNIFEYNVRIDSITKWF